MRKNSKPSLLSGVSVLLMVMMLLILVFNYSCTKSTVKSPGVYVLYEKCVKGFYTDSLVSKPLPCPDTHNFALMITDNPEFIAVCFHSDMKDISHLQATLSGADKSLILSASPEIYDEPMTVSGDTLYSVMVKFILNQKSTGNKLKFSLKDSGNPGNDYNLVLHLREKK